MMCETISKQTLHLHQNVLAKNNRAAENNKQLFRQQLVVNVMSSPGSGKTTLIQQLLMRSQLRTGVIVGDLATDRDAEKIRQTGAPAVPITTGNLCHLEASSVARAAEQLDLGSLDLVIIENVGNLVCPSMYDLGEDLRLILMSVTEGEDKPLKYPTMFKSADAVLMSKMDLAAAVEFDYDGAIACLSQIVPQTKVFEVSARSGMGMDALSDYLVRSLQNKQTSSSLLL